MGNVIGYKRREIEEKEDCTHRFLPMEGKIQLSKDCDSSPLSEGRKPWRKHLIVTTFSIRGVRNIIAEFTGPYSYFPMLYLGMTEIRDQDVKFFKDHLEHHFIRTMDSKNVVDVCKTKVSTLSLLRWHCELLTRAAILTFIPSKYCSYFSHITPYEIGSSHEDLNWYFRWKMERSWKGYSKDEDTTKFRGVIFSRGDECDAMIMSVEYGLMMVSKVPRDYRTVTRTVLEGRWDIADKYVRRGDILSSPLDVLAGLSTDHLDTLLSKYDLWREFHDIRVDAMNDRIVSLLRGGILPYNILERNQEYNIMAGTLSQILPRVPMNVVEDLFTIILFRANRFQRNGWIGGIDAVLDMKTWFFDDLREEKKRPARPSSIHRLFKYSYADLIVATVRNNMKAAELMLGAFIHSPDVGTFLREEEAIPSCA